MMASTSFMNFFVFIFAVLSALVSASPIKRDVFVPPITSPTAGTVWTIGSRQNVTWSLDNVPAQITNPKGVIVLAKDGLLIGLDNPLAQDFDITLGRFEITVPVVAPADDYALVLFGDSGNISPNFTITN
ncbi:hypothetical protein BDY19DRAFT_229775 [Irpex rosettiformis]|uniref:Uncharacterized protein n=1 Tax=Irpex rosettiformis TaxID=378272 RepID=A0ACB8U1E0_9APHY|nr:hypothetical protein BDY19DRAFT_229775 [Irpex rosettiformis]